MIPPYTPQEEECRNRLLRLINEMLQEDETSGSRRFSSLSQPMIELGAQIAIRMGDKEAARAQLEAAIASLDKMEAGQQESGDRAMIELVKG